ncbi:MAG: hypothetical protein IKS45_05180, partial [Thermoguttaceae bacterium]|nr:hypothetical protein [Thermoguttaceae bacterium]
DLINQYTSLKRQSQALGGKRAEKDGEMGIGRFKLGEFREKLGGFWEFSGNLPAVPRVFPAVPSFPAFKRN